MEPLFLFTFTETEDQIVTGLCPAAANVEDFLLTPQCSFFLSGEKIGIQKVLTFVETNVKASYAFINSEKPSQVYFTKNVKLEDIQALVRSNELIQTVEKKEAGLFEFKAANDLIPLAQSIMCLALWSPPSVYSEDLAIDIECEKETIELIFTSTWLLSFFKMFVAPAVSIDPFSSEEKGGDTILLYIDQKDQWGFFMTLVEVMNFITEKRINGSKTICINTLQNICPLKEYSEFETIFWSSNKANYSSKPYYECEYEKIVTATMENGVKLAFHKDLASLKKKEITK